MIVKDYSENIDDFEAYVREKLDSISSLSIGNDSILFRKVLYVSFLDSPAATIYPDKRNKERFVALVDSFSYWEEKDNVSLTHLGKLVAITSDPELEEVRIYVDKQLKQWEQRTNRNIPISEDPSYKDIRNKGWANSKDTNPKVSLANFKHSHLLYQLRNSLIHQFQAKNEPESNNFDSPFYRWTLDSTMKPVQINLIYPAKFLKKISETILCRVIKHLREENINPFPHYYAGDYMLRRLE